MTNQHIDNAVELDLGGFTSYVSRDELQALSPAIAALWQPISDFRDPAYTTGERYELSVKALNAIECPAHGATNDRLLEKVRSLQVGPDGAVAGWHIWRHKANWSRFLCERA